MSTDLYEQRERSWSHFTATYPREKNVPFAFSAGFEAGQQTSARLKDAEAKLADANAALASQQVLEITVKALREDLATSKQGEAVLASYAKAALEHLEYLHERIPAHLGSEGTPDMIYELKAALLPVSKGEAP